MHQSNFPRFWFSWHIKGSLNSLISFAVLSLKKTIRKMLHHQHFNWFIFLVLVIFNLIECVSSDFYSISISFYRWVFLNSSLKTVQRPAKSTINGTRFHSNYTFCPKLWIRRIYTDFCRYLRMHQMMQKCTSEISTHHLYPRDSSWQTHFPIDLRLTHIHGFKYFKLKYASQQMLTLHFNDFDSFDTIFQKMWCLI